MWHIIKLILFFLAYQLAFSGIFTIGYMLYHHSFEYPNMTDKTFCNLTMIAQVLSSAAIITHILAGKYLPPKRASRSSLSMGLISTVVVFMLSITCWVNYLNEWIGLPDNLAQTFALLLNHPLGIISVVLLAPISEELLFRGAIQGYLMRILKKPQMAIILSALIFGIIHGNPAQIPFACITGIALGWIYYRSGNLILSMIMHFVNNGSAFVLYHLTNDPNATMNETFGTIGAFIIAVAGIIISTICILFIQKKLIPMPVSWKKD